MEVLVVREVRALEDLERVDDREAAVELAAGHVVVEVLRVSRTFQTTCRSDDLYSTLQITQHS